MAHTKINYAVIILAAVLLLLGCRKSKEETTVEWVVVNPVTNDPYTNITVRLFEERATGGGIASELVFEGKTNQQGRATYKFRARKSNKYWYHPTINESVLGTGGVDYSIIKQPSPSTQNIKKDELNEMRYEIVPYASFYRHIKNINCQGEDDKMRLRTKNIYTSTSDEFSEWSPNANLNSGYFEGCFEYISPLRTNRSESVVYQMEVTRNNEVEIITKTFYKDPTKIDTIKLYY